MLQLKDEYTETEPRISNHSPRKKILRGKIVALHREVRKLKQQLERQKNKIETSAREISLNEYCEATDKFLPPEIANFVKTQVHLNNCKSAKGRKYPLAFKKFCLGLLFCGGIRVYNSLAHKFILPNVRTLQRMIEQLKFAPGLFLMP